ncbi:MAG: phage portal protein [Gammaproteobacteria bacterium]|nr:phage portal protein [Gammaproteobacteria bacterium]
MKSKTQKNNAKATGSGAVEVFTFGDPTPVMEARDLMGYFESSWNGRYYEPPFNVASLAKSYRANPHHSSAIQVKRNIISSAFIPHKKLSRQQFERFALEQIVFGNSYLEKIENALGGVLRYESPLSKFVRAGKNGEYLYIPNYYDSYPFKSGSIYHLIEPDINQDIYGAPDYLSGLQSAWLNEAATLFRRKYYLNGSHAGFVFYMTDPAQDIKDVDNIRAALKEAKGPGNFRNLFMYSPNGKKDGIQIIPIAEVQAKDEFFNIKNVSRDDVLAAHRVPPQLMGIVPNNAGGFGDIEKAARVFARNELLPLQERMKDFNAWAGEEVISFGPYEISVPGTGQKIKIEVD